MRKEYGDAMRDIAAVLALEPRHFGALTGLGLILQDVGDDKEALKAFRKALAIDPHLDRVPDIVKDAVGKRSTAAIFSRSIRRAAQSGWPARPSCWCCSPSPRSPMC